MWDGMTLVPGRDCGGCTVCCVWPTINKPEIQKQSGAACRHCTQAGCGIYETRPTDCRTFFCEWMLEKGLGPEWKPERAKFALVMGEGGHLTAFVDPGFPASWRGAPYYAAFKKLAGT
jgi:hypothetical protein